MAALAILGVVGGFVGPAIEVVKWISAPLRRQFSYLCCFSSNIKTLEDEAKILDDETRGLQTKVRAATNNAQLILPPVETWLKNSGEKKNEINGILNQVPNVGIGCLKVRERYSLSMQAKKATIDIKELVGKCNFSDISSPPPIAASAPVQSGTVTCDFESRRQVEEEIVKNLGDENVHKIGICGMGGLGKTTMAQKIMNRALKEGLFGEVVMAVVSQSVDKLNIQLQIGEALGLKFDGETLISRANILRQRLRGKKRTLLVLDDVWGNLNIEELGIPCEYGCRVVLTSRNKGVFNEMGVEKVCELRILDEEEAWFMFRGKAGMCVDAAALNPIAKDVMKECKGLPIALANVGLALKDETDVSMWEDALGQLRRSNPVDIPSIIEQVYNPLKLSYDRLGNPNAKSIFLLCCLFPEDFDIPQEHLTYFATGMHLFEDIWELKELRGRMSSLVKTLKTRGLLLDGSDDDHVRMHDVARDVSIFIASTERRVKCRDCTWISSYVSGGARHIQPHDSVYPKLKLLLMSNKVEEQEVEIPEDNLIGRSPELNVLFIEYGFFRSVPQLSSTSVVTLVLYNCVLLESITVVGQLKSLEIFVCSNCHLIKELPEQIRGLKCLKILEISYCHKLKKVEAGVISSLVLLEELTIIESFDNWKGGEIEEGNGASLREIESLKKLRCLYIEVFDIALAAQPLSLSSKLVQFIVRIGEAPYGCDAFPEESYERRMCLNFGDEKHIEWGDLSSNIFLTRTESLFACGDNQDFNLNLESAHSIRWLSLNSFTNKKNITSVGASFRFLQFLCLNYLPNLEEVWDDDDAPVPSNSFNNLKHLNLQMLPALKRMGKSVLSTSKDFFSQLEKVEIQYCDEMEHLLVVVPKEEEQDKENHINTVLIFPKLKILCLTDLPKLTSMIYNSSSRGIESIQFPLLAQMEIGYCDNLRCFVSRYDDDHHHHYLDNDDDSLHLFCYPKVSFGNLTKLTLERNRKSKNVWCDHVPVAFFRGLVELRISEYTKIRRLFSSSKIPQNLVNLQKLHIYECREMVKVIEDENVSSWDYVAEHTPLFPSLQEMWLELLPELESFCEWRSALELPSLKNLEIFDSNKMESFISAGSLTAPSLQTVKVNGVYLECVDDLNAALHYQFEKAKRESKKEEEGTSDFRGRG